MPVRAGGSSRRRALLLSLFVLSASLLAACGSSDSARDDALAALDRATDAAGLEAEMAALVSDLPDAPSPEERDEATQSIAELDERAGDVIASAGTGNDYDEEIRSSAEEIRSAGSDLADGLAEPASLGDAKIAAVGSLQASNESLTTATEQIGGELADDEGTLSAEDADALEATLGEIETSGKAVAAAESSLADAPLDDPEPAPAAGECTVVDAGSGAEYTVVIEAGTADCVEATAIFEEFYGGEFRESAEIGGWSCSRTANLLEGVAAFCTRGNDQAAARVAE